MLKTVSNARSDACLGFGGRRAWVLAGLARSCSLHNSCSLHEKLGNATRGPTQVRQLPLPLLALSCWSYEAWPFGRQRIGCAVKGRFVSEAAFCSMQQVNRDNADPKPSGSRL